LIENSGKTSCATWKSKGKQKAIDLDCVKIKTRKPIQGNWMNSKVLALINAKKAKDETSLEVDVDSRDNMETTITKWKHIFLVVTANFHSHHHRNGLAKIDGSLCMEITRKYMTTKILHATMNNTGTCL